LRSRLVDLFQGGVEIGHLKTLHDGSPGAVLLLAEHCHVLLRRVEKNPRFRPSRGSPARSGGPCGPPRGLATLYGQIGIG
jgi:hypothetical protein